LPRPIPDLLSLSIRVCRTHTARAGIKFPAGEKLSDRARARLAVENDDRSFALVDVLPLARRCAGPVVWDVLHHRCHDPAALADDEALGWRSQSGRPE
jgi:UV DNA damage repair endonuclease